MNRRLLSGAGCCAAGLFHFAIGLPAQEPPVALPPLRVPIHTAPDDHGVPYGIWAATSSYKASFHDGMTFVPYLGSAYPHNQPFAWRTVSVRVGPTELLLPGATPEPVQRDFRYEYRFAAFTEAYDVRDDGLEQSFVIHQRPGPGDLVITGRVSSRLHCPDRDPAHQALHFADATGQEIVGYGRAIAIDARGRRIAIDTGYRDGSISLAVPGSWLEHAAWPIVVDPLLQRLQVMTSGSEVIAEVAVARESVSRTTNLLFVMTYSASAQDDDVASMLCNDDLTLVASPFYDISMSWDADGVSCAFVGGADKWAIVYRRHFYNDTVRRSWLRCHVHARGNTQTSTSTAGITAPAGYNDWRPAVGGIASHAAGNHALVVFQREDNFSGNWVNSSNSAIYGVLLDVTSTVGTFGTPFPIWNVANNDAERPTVNQVAEGGTSFAWICAFQAYDYQQPGRGWNLRARRVTSSGLVSLHAWQSAFAQTSTRHQMGPVVAGSSGRYAIAFATLDLGLTTLTKPAEITGNRIWVERIDWASTATPSASLPPVLLAGFNNSIVYEATGIAYDTITQSHFAVGFHTVPPATPSVQCARVGYNGGATEGPLTMYINGLHTPVPPRCTFDDDRPGFVFTYGVNIPDRTIHNPQYGHVLTYTAPAPIALAGTACRPVALGWQGSQQIGSQFGSVSVANAPAGTLHFLLASLGVADLPIPDPAVAAGCRLLIDTAGGGYLGNLGLRIGTVANWSLPLPEWLQSFTVHFQDWMFDGSTFGSSRRLTVPFVR